MAMFNFHAPTRILFGPGCLADLGATPTLPQGKKALLVIGQGGSAIRNGHLARVQGLLASRGVATAVYDRIRPNPESGQVDEAATQAREDGVDFIVGLGGGSSLDAAKAIALMAANPGILWDYMPAGTGGRRTPERPALPVVAIPTTAGTGSEANPRAIISRSGGREKMGVGHDSLFPALAVVDPELTLTAPKSLTATTGMDAFFHATETYLSKASQPISDLMAMESLNLLANHLPAAVIDGEDIQARTVVSFAATMSGICLALSAPLSLHALEHSLSALAPDLPHGAGLAALATPYFTRMAELAPERFDHLALVMGIEPEDLPETERPYAFAQALEDLLASVGLGEIRLSDYGITPDHLPDIVRNARETAPARFAQDPAPLSDQDCLDILDSAYL